jgi:outer membrane protein assembly factor BamB
MKAFVAIPFSPKFDIIWDTIEHVCTANNITAIRADYMLQMGNILAQIEKAIEDSDFIIVDFSGDKDPAIPNANVVTEAKHASMKNKRMVILTQNPIGLPFDWTQYRAIIYQNDQNGITRLKTVLANILKPLIPANLTTTEATYFPPPEPIKISCYRGDMQRTGIYPSKAIRTLNDCLWKFKMQSVQDEEEWTLYEKPRITVSKESTYLCDDDYLIALETATGKLKWRFHTSQLDSPYITNDALYFIGDNPFDETLDYLFAINPQTGHPLSALPIKLWEGTISKYQLFYKDTIFVMSDNYYAIDTKTKTIKCKISDYSGSTTPAISDEIMYFGNSKSIVALELNTGKTLWSSSANYHIGSNPVIAGKAVYFGCNNWYLYALDIGNGEMKWRFKAKAQITHPPAVFNETVYFSSGDTLYALDTQTQTKKWEISYPNTELLEPAITEDIIYLGSHTDRGKAHLYAIDINTGNEIWKFKTQGSSAYSPVIFDGVLYFVSNDGFMYALH